MKIMVKLNGQTKYVQNINHSTSTESVSLVTADTEDKASEWSYRGLTMLSIKFPNLVFVVV